MQNGPKVNFTEFERQKFNAICSEWKEAKNHTPKKFPEWSAEKLGGKSSSEYVKFVSYLKTVQAVNQLSQAREKVQSARQGIQEAQQDYVQATNHLHSLQAHKANLERQIQSDTQRIESSREQTAKRIASHVDGIKVGPSKRQY